VLADVMMPGLDGFELLRELRADTVTRDIPVILLSARVGEESIIEGLAVGADDYLIKPFSAWELLARVEAHLKLKRLREEAQEALRESEKRFRHMADNAPVMIWVTDPDARGTYLSRSWYDFTGQTPETGLGFGWVEAVHPEDRAYAHDTFVAASAKREAFQLEYRLRRHDGEYRWAINAAAPRFGDDGKFLGYIGSVIDITERKQAEEAQQLLLSELNHRVKNMLASVQAIVQQTVRRTKDPLEFATSVAGRIQSLALVHSLLTNATWQDADLRELIRDQLLQGAVDDTRITAWCPAVRLPAQTALHLALMLHELGTNANKYGALSRTEGWVTISWTIDNGLLRLRLVERGGPMASAPTTRGFGINLIEQSAKGEGGDAQMSLQADGLVWEITLPRPAAADASRPGSSNVRLIDSAAEARRAGTDQDAWETDGDSLARGRGRAVCCPRSGRQLGGGGRQGGRTRWHRGGSAAYHREHRFRRGAARCQARPAGR
jgi:PAS domain S-box-containing protein